MASTAVVENPNGPLFMTTRFAPMLRFDPATNTYIYYGSGVPNDLTTSTRFESNEIVGAPANFETRRHGYTGDSGQSGSLEDLKLFVPGSANTQLALTYVSYGVRSIWRVNSPYEYREYFYYGVSTPTANLPTSGSASLSGIAEGTFFDGTVPYRLTGSSTLSADFAAGTVTASLNLNGTTQIIGANPFGSEQYAGLGVIGANNQYPPPQFYGTLTSTTNVTHTGNFSGSFFGPAANEYGFIFSISRGAFGTPGGGVGVGVAVGN